MKNGRIAIPSLAEGGLDGQRSGHFGHCDVFTLVDVQDGKISNVMTVANQEHQEGGCLVPVNTLANLQVNALVVSGIGPRPLIGFNQAGIDVYHETTCAEIRPVVEDLIADKLPIISVSNQRNGTLFIPNTLA